MIRTKEVPPHYSNAHCQNLNRIAQRSVFSNSGPCDGRKRSSPVEGQCRGLRVLASAPSWELLAKGSTPVRLQLVVGQVDKPTSSSVSSFATIGVLGLEAGPQMQQWPLKCSELERDCWWLGGLNRQNVWPATKFRSGGGLAGHPSENRFGINSCQVEILWAL